MLALLSGCTLSSLLSRAIKELEEDLGAQLFVRNTRSTRLTRAGQLFLEHVPRVFTALQQARDSVKAAANGFHNQLRVALSDGIPPSRFSTFLALCREEEPEIEIRLSEVSLAQQIKGCTTTFTTWGLLGRMKLATASSPKLSGAIP